MHSKNEQKQKVLETELIRLSDMYIVLDRLIRAAICRMNEPTHFACGCAMYCI